MSKWEVIWVLVSWQGIYHNTVVLYKHYWIIISHVLPAKIAHDGTLILILGLKYFI